MAQYKKLFDNAEIEYITPFLKLWMAFNNWYKKDKPSLRKDRNAINEYKKSGQLKTEFLRLLNLNSEIDFEFQNAINDLILCLENFDLKKEKSDGSTESVNFKIKDEKGNKTDLISEYVNKREEKEPTYFSTVHNKFQILEENKEKFYEQTLEIIYQIRCNLVHGSFDIENQNFLKLVECSYKILYPIIERILINQEIENKNKLYFSSSYFDELTFRIKNIINSGDKPMKKIIDIYVTSIDFRVDGIDLARTSNIIYKKLFGKSVIELKKENGLVKKGIYDYLSVLDKNKINEEAIHICLIAQEKAENKIPMKMDDWKKEFNKLGN